MKTLADRAMTIVGYCNQHPDMRAAGYVSLILNRSDERIAKLEAALRGLLECSACQNGCTPDDMTCATNVARAALAGKVME